MKLTPKQLKAIAEEINTILGLKKKDQLNASAKAKALEAELRQAVGGKDPEVEIYAEDDFAEESWTILAELGCLVAKEKVVEEEEEEEPSKSKKKAGKKKVVEEEEEEEEEDEEEEDEEEEDEEEEDEEEEDEEEEDEEIDYEALSRKELKAICKEEGIKISKNAKKPALIEILTAEDEEADDEEEEEEDDDDNERQEELEAMSAKELKKVGKAAGLKNKAMKELNKEDLIVAILEVEDEDNEEEEEEEEEVKEVKPKKEKKTEKKATSKKKPVKGKTAFGKDLSTTRKAIIHKAWKKNKKISVKEAMKVVDNDIKDSTVARWLKLWPEGLKLPAGEK